MKLTCKLHGYNLPVRCTCGGEEFTYRQPETGHDAIELEAMRGYIYFNCVTCGRLNAQYLSNVIGCLPATVIEQETRLYQ